MKTMKLKALFIVVPIVLLLSACGGSSETTTTKETIIIQSTDNEKKDTPSAQQEQNITQEETSQVVIYATGDSVSIKPGDTYKALTDDTQVKMITDLESDETVINVLSGQMEVTFN